MRNTHQNVQWQMHYVVGCLALGHTRWLEVHIPITNRVRKTAAVFMRSPVHPEIVQNGVFHGGQHQTQSGDML